MISAELPLDVVAYLDRTAAARLSSRSAIIRQILDRARREKLLLRDAPVSTDRKAS